MINPFEFKPRVAVEAILALAAKVQVPTIHRIEKMTYFADRLHLERYGRFISGDSYVAMRNGPAPENIRDMLKSASGKYKHMHFSKVSAAFKVEGYNIVAMREPNMKYLSDSDVECLNAAVDIYDRFSTSELTMISQDCAWSSAGKDDFISIQAIVMSLGNNQQLIEYLEDPHP